MHGTVLSTWSLGVLQTVKAEALDVSFDEQADRTSDNCPTGRVSTESGQINQSAKAHDSKAKLISASSVGTVFDCRSDDLEACGDAFSGGLGLGCHQRDDVRASGAVLSVVGDACGSEAVLLFIKPL